MKKVGLIICAMFFCMIANAVRIDVKTYEYNGNSILGNVDVYVCGDGDSMDNAIAHLKTDENGMVSITGLAVNTTYTIYFQHGSALVTKMDIEIPDYPIVDYDGPIIEPSLELDVHVRRDPSIQESRNINVKTKQLLLNSFVAILEEKGK